MKTVQEIRAEVEAAKKVARARFEQDWGTRDVGVVMCAMRQTIPGSRSPNHAAQMARALLRKSA